MTAILSSAKLLNTVYSDAGQQSSSFWVGVHSKID